MKRFASVRFEAVLAAIERESVARSLASVGATVTSWVASADRTYARAELTPGVLPAVAGARIDEPPLVVLRVTPRDPARVAGLARTLGGAGRPLGIVDMRPETAAVTLAFAPRVTSLGFIVAAIDAELERAPGRTIEPLFPLDDETLASFASELLDEPDLDAARLLETYLEPLLAGETA